MTVVDTVDHCKMLVIAKIRVILAEYAKDCNICATVFRFSQCKNHGFIANAVVIPTRPQLLYCL